MQTARLSSSSTDDDSAKEQSSVFTLGYVRCNHVQDAPNIFLLFFFGGGGQSPNEMFS